MGTSLSGLTPATTFDGLLKTSDNDALDATLKTIGTGDGTDSVLQLSNSALQIGGTFNVDGGIATFKGVGSSYLTSSFIIKNSADAEIFRVRDDAQIYAAYISAQSVNASSYALYGADYAPNIRVNIKGSGATSATTSLLVQNSAGSDYLKVTDDGNVQLGSSISVQSTGISAYNSIQLKTFIGGGVYESGLVLTGNGAPSKVGIGETTPTARLHIKGSGNTNTTTSLLVQNSDGSASLTYDDSGKVEIVGNSQTGFIQTYGFGAVGFGNESGPTILYGNNLSGLHTNNGYTAFGANSSTSQRVLIKGSGATSATTALLVQNSAGTDMLKVQDDSSLLMYRASNGAELLKIGESGGNAILYANGNSNRSLVLGYQNTLTAFNQTEFKTYNGTGYSEAMVITGNSNTSQFVGIGETTPTAKLQVKGSGNDATTTALLVQNSDGTDMLSVKDDLSVVFNSTITSASSTLRFDVGGVGTIRMNSDKVAIGGNTTPTARLHVKGSGATSATTALLVENSAGTDIFKVNDAGQATASGSMTAGYFSAGTSILGSAYARVRNTKLYPSQSGTGINIQADATNNPPDASAVLQADSTTQGFLPPRMTDAERDAIATPAAGLMIYDTSNNQMNYWNGSSWIAF